MLHGCRRSLFLTITALVLSVNLRGVTAACPSTYPTCCKIVRQT